MATQESRRLRVGVIGLRMGASMVQALGEHPRAEIRAVCDVSEERTREIAEAHGVSGAYADYREMLEREDLDGVCISTPNRLHAPMVRAALERRLHVLCEKPLTLDTGEAWELLTQARAAGVTHGVNFSNRPNPTVHFMKRQIEAGVLGRIYEIHLAYMQDWLSNPDAPYTWRNNRAESGSGALGDVGSHILDLGRLFAGEVTAISAHLTVAVPRRHRADGPLATVDADDLASAQLQFANGAPGLLRVSRMARGRCDIRRLELFGSQASLVLEIDHGVNRVLRADEATAWRGDGFREVFAHDPRLSDWGGNVRTWVDAALAGKEMAPSFEDGLRCQEILDAAVQSDAERRWVEIEHRQAAIAS